MSFSEIQNIRVKGISACVPSNKATNYENPVFQSSDDAEKFINTTFVKEFRVAPEGITTSDLCLHAAEKLIEDLDWDKNSIDCLIFVTQTPDYILPASSCILQDRLGLPSECFTLDISLGCSGWVNGLGVISSMLSGGWMKRGLLLAGDVPSKIVSKDDNATAPLFGDAGTATAVEFDPEAAPMKFHFATDGSGYEAIIIPDGGIRNQVTLQSFERVINQDGEQEKRNSLQVALNGMDVFSFGISKAPQTVKKLVEKFSLDMDKVDYFIFHQANGFMNEKIRAKLKLDSSKVPYSMDKFGNTSSASIPITICSEIRNNVHGQRNKIICCGFGVGLSWGSVYFETDGIVCPEVLEI